MPMTIWRGMRVKYKGETYCVTAYGDDWVRIDQLPDVSLVVRYEDIERA